MRERIDLKNGQTAPIDLPESDVLLYEMDGIDWFCIRPSGTEPKIKIYFGVYADSQESCDNQLNTLRGQVEQYLRSYL